ncbi:MAG: SGNH/GDSL hydrolase family protein [Rhodobacteraceae bacterium]|nr:SGNH/GDSL hydrolase family protein [Paracoccaceae bacterium]
MTVKRILCYGDSNTYGADPEGGPRLGASVRWTGALAQLLGAEYTIIEEGLGGRTTVLTDPYEPFRNGRDYLRPCLMSHDPLDLVIMMLGTNDLKSRFSVSSEDIGRGNALLIKDIRETLGPDIKIVIVAPVPVGEGRRDDQMIGGDAIEKSHDLARVFAAIAVEHKVGFFDASKVGVLDHGDALHLSPADHAGLAAGLAQIVKDLL